MNSTRPVIIFCSFFLWALSPSASLAAETSTSPDSTNHESSPADILSPRQWERIDHAVDRALAWLAMQQQADGSFRTMDTGQPAITALCVLAYLSRGHLPGQGPYGEVIDRAIGFVLGCQHPDGLITLQYPTNPVSALNDSHTANYNHAISGLMLSEVYGMTSKRTNQRIGQAIKSALLFSEKKLPQPKRRAEDQGGWRYSKPKPWPEADSDLSVTSWQLMFLRSARNAGFEVPARHIDEALAFVQLLYDPGEGAFRYSSFKERQVTRGMTGAGILSLSLGGRHQTEQARRAGEWLLHHPFDQYNAVVGLGDRFFYGAFYCSQAMFQLGERYWADFYPTLLNTLVDSQRRDGSWDLESQYDRLFGSVYSTALAVLAISPPYQLLPIYQR